MCRHVILTASNLFNCTADILLAYQAKCTGVTTACTMDFMAVPPVALAEFGFPSSGYAAQFTFTSDATTLSWTRTDGNTGSGPASSIGYAGLGLSGKNSAGAMFQVVAPTEDLHCIAVGDGDGSEGAAFLHHDEHPVFCGRG
eukprot:m.854524 g.854524  ORF g.854524 m.854524 type:complete len:142 (-) comp23504_c0_seq13:4996-5421(-)